MLIRDDRVLEGAPPSGHKPVLLEETMRLMSPSDGKTYLDCTFGGGGHTRAMLDSADCRVIAIDRDAQAEERAERLAKLYPARFEFRPLKFSQLDKIQTTGYAGVLFDFGVSSFQLDDARRGFSFMRDGELDMRMNTREGMSALEYVNSADEAQLRRDLREFGEEPRAGKIARAIVDARRSGEIRTTAELARIISEASPNPRGKIHPATRSFQAIRIRVNDELGEIETALPKAFERLENGGVLAAISFHSLEDRLVKRFFKKMAGRPVDENDRSFAQDRTVRARLLTRKPVTASEAEAAGNPRSRSAKLRAIVKDEK